MEVARRRPRRTTVSGDRRRLVSFRLAGGTVALACVTAVAWLSVPTSAFAQTTSAKPLAASAGSPVTVAPVPAPPAGATKLGSLPAATSMTLDVVLKPRDAAGLEATATAVSTPGSASRGEYLTPAQIKSRFAPTTAQVQAVVARLKSTGLRVSSVTADNLTVRVTGSAATIASAFHTSFARYRLTGGRVAYANTAPARLPAAIGSKVETLLGMSEISRFEPLDLSRRAEPTVSEKPSTTASSRASQAPVPCAAAVGERSLGALTADQLAAAYGMTGAYAADDYGSGVTVGLFELEPDEPSDIAAYEACYGISTPVSYVPVDGGSGDTQPYGSGEAALDIEDIAGLAPDANIEVYQGPNDNVGPFDLFQYIVDHPTAKIISTSWGECEYFLGSTRAAATKAADAEETLFEIAAAEGQTWIAAAGDSGSTDCDPAAGLVANELAVDDPGSQPFVTSVGGTSLHTTATTGYSQTVWNDSVTQQGAGGGGISGLWRMPAYQSGAAASLGVVDKYSSAKPCLATTGDCREVPDVTADADPLTGFPIYYLGAWQVIGGTSGSAPLWAAVAALVDASPVCADRSVGFLNPVLYDVAGTSKYASDFTDITTGNNDYTPSGLTSGLYKATPGYDMASGLGAPLVTSPSGGLATSLCSALGATRPGVDSLSPATGPKKGGTKVTIAGYGFTDVTAVYFGKHPAKFTFDKATATAPAKIVATAPAGTGKQWVTVHNGTNKNLWTPGDEYSYS